MDKVHSVSSKKVILPNLEVPLFIKEMKQKMELDTGCSANFLIEECWKILGKPSLAKPKENFMSAYRHQLPVTCCITAKTRLKDSDEVRKVQYHVSKVMDLNLLGRTAAGNLGISLDKVTKAVSRNSDESGKVSVNTVDVDTDLQKACQDLCKEFPNIWKSELGCLKDVELEVKFKQGVQQIIKKARPVPFALQEDVNNAYAQGIAKSAGKPTQFCEYGTPVVPIRKAMLPGQLKPKLRVCGDYSITVNPQLEIRRSLNI